MNVDLQRRVFVVTGANTGTGRITTFKLAQSGTKVIMACRSEKKTLPVMEEI